nr:hypothetical protein [Acuticoccus mangrovi]
MNGFRHDDHLTGTNDANRLYSFDGDDVVMRLGGDDSLAGEAGDDTTDGGTGDDTLDGVRGDNDLTGGPGYDIVVADFAPGDTVVRDFDPGEDRIHFYGESYETFMARAVQDGADVVYQRGNTYLGYETSLRIGNTTLAALTPDVMLFD